MNKRKVMAILLSGALTAGSLAMPMAAMAEPVSGIELAAAKDSGWVKEAGKWYYVSPETKERLKSCVAEINGSNYAFSDSGVLAINKWIKVNGAWYHADSNGVVGANEWVLSGSNRYYLGQDGKMLVDTQATIDGKVYSFDKNGIAVDVSADPASDRRSIGSYAIYSDVAIMLNHCTINGSIGSNGYINFKDSNANVSGAVTAVGEVKGTYDLSCENVLSNDATSGLAFQDHCDRVWGWLKENIINKDTDTMDKNISEYLVGTVVNGPEWVISSLECAAPWTYDGSTISMTDDYFFSGDVKGIFEGNYWNQFSGQSVLCIDHDVYVDGNCNLMGSGKITKLVIEEGATLYVTGNCNSDLTDIDIRGNLIVEGNYVATNAKITSSSSTPSYIYVGGSAVMFGPVGQSGFNSVHMIFPNNTSFSWDGNSQGAVAISGSVCGKTLVGFNQGKLTFTYSDDAGFREALYKGWKKVSGKWFYIDPYAEPVFENHTSDVEGVSYGFGADGALVLNKWLEIGNGEGSFWIRTDKSGKVMKSTFITSGNKKYYVDENGVMLSGCTVTIDGTEYTFDSTGRLVA